MRNRASLVATAGVVLLVIGLAPAAAQDDPGGYRSAGDPGGFLNIVPPGQDGVLNPGEATAAQAGAMPPNVANQLDMYGDLVYEDATPGLTHADLAEFFKDASFGVAPDALGDVESCPSSATTQVGASTPPACYHPGGRDDVVVLRDEAFGVPHVFGDTREGTMFAAGYTGAEDRLFLMDVLRHLGRAELSAFLGASPGNRQMDRDQLTVAPYSEEDLEEQAEQLRSYGEVGEQIYADGQAYIAGVNQYITEALANPSKLPAEYPALQQLPEEFVPADIVAIASLVGGIFGRGGGREVRNYCGLDALAAEVGDLAEARAIFDDLHFANDPEAPTTAPRPFPYMTSLDGIPAAQPDLDCDSLSPVTAPPPDPSDLPGQAVDAVIDAVPVPPLPGDSASGTTSGRGTIDGPLGEIRLDLPSGASNALLVAGSHTASGRPIAVFGPQTGYFIPQLLVEKDIHGPGIDARGVSFAGTDLYIQLGRGRDYAWSATSAGGDNVDEWTLELCDPEGGEATSESMGYRHRGECKPIETHQELVLAKPSAGGIPEEPSPESLVINKYFERVPDYGPITARGETSDGTPVAIAVQRSTYGQELRSAIGFNQINDPDFMRDGFEAFRRAFGQGVDYTFNWFYVDEQDIGYQHSCLCPLRHPDTDPYLPSWGTGEWDWQGFLGLPNQPTANNPSSGYLTSWNNRQAPAFTANDGNFNYGPVYRADLLNERIETSLAAAPMTRPELVDIMELAGTTDLRAQEIVPRLIEVMGDEPPPDLDLDPRTAHMWDEVTTWAADDHGHRRDHDADGEYEHAVAIAIMDAWWGGAPAADSAPDDSPNPNARSQLVEAIFGTAFEHLGMKIVDSPMLHLGSAFNGGAESHVDKDLRQVLGARVDGQFHRTYCGDGDREACVAALWRSLSDTAGELEAGFESSDIDDWRRQPADDEIRHAAVGVAGVDPIHWVNRPTFQQVVEVGAPLDAPLEDADMRDPPRERDRGGLPATGGPWPALLGIVLLALAVGVGRRRAGWPWTSVHRTDRGATPIRE